MVPNYTSLAGALVDLFGTTVKIAQTDRLSGGDINKAYGLTLNNGRHIFMKANAKTNAAFFTAEAAGLQAIADTHTIGTPRILCTGTDDGEDVGYSFLLLEYIQSAGRRSDYWEVLGQDLANLHKASTGVPEPVEGPAYQYGFPQNNFIGARPQKKYLDRELDNFFPRLPPCSSVPRCRLLLYGC